MTCTSKAKSEQTVLHPQAVASKKAARGDNQILIAILASQDKQSYTLMAVIGCYYFVILVHL